MRGITLSLRGDDELVVKCQKLLATASKVPTGSAAIRQALQFVIDNHCPDCGKRYLKRTCPCKTGDNR
jgi:hypothetical protein